MEQFLCRRLKTHSKAPVDRLHYGSEFLKKRKSNIEITNTALNSQRKKRVESKFESGKNIPFQ